MEREASNPARGRVRFYNTFCHRLTEGRRGLTEGYLGILDLLFGDRRLDLLNEALEGTQRCPVSGIPLHGLACSTNRRFVYNRHSRFL